MMTIEILTLIILFLTFVAVAAYTFIAKKQTDELIRQRALSIMPSISTKLSIHAIMDSRKEKFDSEYIELIFQPVELINIGNGPALNISIELPIPEKEDFQFIFNVIHKLDAKERRNIDFRVVFGKQTNDADQGEIIFLSYLSQKESLDISMHFQDLEGKKYKQISSIGKTARQNQIGFVKPIKET